MEAVRRQRLIRSENAISWPRPDGIEHLVNHQRLTLFSSEEYESALRIAGLSFEAVASPTEGRDRYVGVKRT